MELTKNECHVEKRWRTCRCEKHASKSIPHGGWADFSNAERRGAPPFDRAVKRLIRVTLRMARIACFSSPACVWEGDPEADAIQARVYPATSGSVGRGRDNAPFRRLFRRISRAELAPRRGRAAPVAVRPRHDRAGERVEQFVGDADIAGVCATFQARRARA